MIINGIAGRQCGLPGLTDTPRFPCQKVTEDKDKCWDVSRYECRQYAEGPKGDCATNDCWCHYHFDENGDIVCVDRFGGILKLSDKQKQAQKAIFEFYRCLTK